MICISIALCNFQNYEAYFDLYRGNANINIIMLLLNKALFFSFFSFPIAFLLTFFFFKLGVSKNCTSPAVFSFSISKLVRCSEPRKGLLTHIAYLASLLSLFLRNCGKESDTMGAYQKKPAISSFSLGTFSVLQTVFILITVLLLCMACKSL